MKRFLVGLTGVMIVLGVGHRDARAGGMEWPDNGTRSLGRGGAFTAKADDPTAIVLNPAGLGSIFPGANVRTHSHRISSTPNRHWCRLWPLV